MGEMQVVEDVAAAFTGLMRTTRPRSFAISGGSTAKACYEHLAEFQDLDWARMDILVGDERWVPVDDPDSNEGMARAALLDRVGAKRVHSARNAGGALDEAAAAYNGVVARFRAIDLIHLGLGEDGHTASLFPRAPALDETERLVVATADPHHPHPRLTFTYPAIARGRLVVFTVDGASKREAFARVRSGEDVPASRVHAERIVWLVSPEVVARAR
jgi:6-phosphogluconolactonase